MPAERHGIDTSGRLEIDMIYIKYSRVPYLYKISSLDIVLYGLLDKMSRT
jgi:hypothetical protein